jgi:hypothetical protein
MTSPASATDTSGLLLGDSSALQRERLGARSAEGSAMKKTGLRLLKYTIYITLILLVLGLPCWIYLHQVKISFLYEAKAEFIELPTDDKALEEWLLAQPGVVKASSQRENKAIRIYWIMNQNSLGNPPTPDLRAEFDQLGYRELVILQYGHSIDK